MTKKAKIETTIKYDLIAWQADERTGEPGHVAEHIGLTSDELRDAAVEIPSPDSTLADHLYRAAVELEAALLKLKGRDTAAPGYSEHYFGIGRAAEAVVEALAREMISAVLGIGGAVAVTNPKPAHSALVNRLMPGEPKRKRAKGSEVRQ